MYFLKFKKICLCLCLLIISLPSFAISMKSFYELTLSILSYVQWDTEDHIFCVINSEELAKNFKQTAKQNKYSYKIISFSHTIPLNLGCNIVFFSSDTPIQSRNTILRQLKYSPLSFTMNDHDCDTTITFCLYRRKDDFTFNINLDALSHSKYHLDSRVLLLVKENN